MIPRTKIAGTNLGGCSFSGLLEMAIWTSCEIWFQHTRTRSTINSVRASATGCSSGNLSNGTCSKVLLYSSAQSLQVLDFIPMIDFAKRPRTTEIDSLAKRGIRGVDTSPPRLARPSAVTIVRQQKTSIQIIGNLYILVESQGSHHNLSGHSHRIFLSWPGIGMSSGRQPACTSRHLTARWATIDPQYVNNDNCDGILSFWTIYTYTSYQVYVYLNTSSEKAPTFTVTKNGGPRRPGHSSFPYVALIVSAGNFRILDPCSYK